MAISPVSMAQTPVVFKGRDEKETGGGGKAVASLLIPGLGQFLDGRKKAGAAFLGSAGALYITSNLIRRSLPKDLFIATAENATKAFQSASGKLAALGLIGIATIGVHIASAVNAYKGKKEKEEVTPTQEQQTVAPMQAQQEATPAQIQQTIALMQAQQQVAPAQAQQIAVPAQVPQSGLEAYIK